MEDGFILRLNDMYPMDRDMPYRLRLSDPYDITDLSNGFIQSRYMDIHTSCELKHVDSQMHIPPMNKILTPGNKRHASRFCQVEPEKYIS